MTWDEFVFVSSAPIQKDIITLTFFSYLFLVAFLFLIYCIQQLYLSWRLHHLEHHQNQDIYHPSEVERLSDTLLTIPVWVIPAPTFLKENHSEHPDRPPSNCP